MTKLTLFETVALALTNHFPLELVPGETDKSHRFHCLIIHPDFPELSLVFGDENHGYLFDSAWASTLGGKVRVKEAEIRELLESKISVPRWTREMPAADNPVRIPLRVANPDLGTVVAAGIVSAHNDDTIELILESNDRVLISTDERPKLGSHVIFEATYHLNSPLSDAVNYEAA